MVASRWSTPLRNNSAASAAAIQPNRWLRSATMTATANSKKAMVLMARNREALTSAPSTERVHSENPGPPHHSSPTCAPYASSNKATQRGVERLLLSGCLDMRSLCRRAVSQAVRVERQARCVGNGTGLQVAAPLKTGGFVRGHGMTSMTSAIGKNPPAANGMGGGGSCAGEN